MAKRPQKQRSAEMDSRVALFLRIMPVIFSAISFIGGVLAAMIMISKNIATIPYVDEKHKESMEHADKAAIEAKNQAFDRAEMVRKDIMGEIKSQSADIRAMGAKQDILLDSVKTIQQNIFETRKR